MRNFVLFRLTAHPVDPLLVQHLTREAVLQRSLAALSSGLMWRRWQAQKVKELSGDRYSLEVGRLGIATIQSVDETGQFMDEDIPIAPRTTVLIDTSFQICAVEDTPQFRGGKSLKRPLQSLLAMAANSVQLDFTFELRELRQPKEFITQLESAFLVRSMTLTIGRPNPWDVTNDFLKPTSEAVEKMGASGVKAKFSGEKIDVRKPEVKALIDEAMAAGNSVEAKIVQTQGERAIPIKPGTPATVAMNDNASENDCLDESVEKYKSIRAGSE